MFLKYCESNSNSVNVAEINKIQTISVKNSENKTVHIVSCYVSGGFERIDIMTETFDQALNILNRLYDDGRLDISPDSSLIVLVDLGPVNDIVSDILNDCDNIDDEDYDYDALDGLDEDDIGGIDFSSFV